MSIVKLIGLEDLPDNFRLLLEDNFRKQLFKKAVKNAGGFLKLAKKLEYDHSALTKVRRGFRKVKEEHRTTFIPVFLLKKLISMTNTNVKEVERNITGITTNKAIVRTKFPIHSSPELASLIGHSLGDGCTTKDRFKYVNKRKELVDEVKLYARIVFGANCREYYIEKKECYGIGFPAIVGRLLFFSGGPLGRKTTQTLKIPSWIKNGSKEMKIAFIRALFDDDGSVCMCKRQSFISISQYKDKKLLKYHKIFLNEIRQVLESLDVNPTKISWKKDYKNTTELGFRIYAFNSLLNFKKTIGFTHLLKHQKLIKLLEHKSHYYFH